MSPINIHDVFIPIYLSALRSTSHILTKGLAHTTAQHLPEAQVLSWRLAPDMNPLSFQVTNICAIARNLIIIVAGMPLSSIPSQSSSTPSYPNTFAGLQAELKSTIELLEGTTREMFEGRDEALVEVKALGMRMRGLQYVQEFGVPNFFFHNSMVYALFRGNEAPIGKWDYLKGGK